MLLFKRDELDAWLEGHREEARSPESLLCLRRPAAEEGGRNLASPRSPHRERKGTANTCHRRQEAEMNSKKKDGLLSLRFLDRAELDEMSPSDFKAAWERRNRPT